MNRARRLADPRRAASRRRSAVAGAGAQPAARAGRRERALALVVARTSMPTGGRSCWRATAIGARSADWFEARDFVEVETAALQVSPGNEAHLHAFATERDRPDGRAQPLYLHTSPEFACKKLLAAGERRIFTFARSFATASAARCTIPSSPCSNGTAPASPTRR